MNTDALQRLKEGQADCPSDLALDRLHARELPPDRAQAVQAHIDACTVCPARMAQRQAGLDGFAEVDPRPLLAAIRRGVDADAATEKRSKVTAWRKWLALIVAPLGVAATLAVVMWARHPAVPVTGDDLDGYGEGGDGDSGPDQTRTKGSLALRVYRQVQGPGSPTAQSQQMVSGDRFAPGDKLRFVVDLPSDGQVAIVGVEASGATYTAWPSQNNLATARPGGKDQQLPGAVALDNSKGRETLYLVHCPHASEPPQCTHVDIGDTAAAGGTVSSDSRVSTGSKNPGTRRRLRCPRGCRMVPFVVVKDIDG